jgi:hypothetical protein
VRLLLSATLEGPGLADHVRWPQPRGFWRENGALALAEWPAGIEGQRVSFPLLLPPGETRLTFGTDSRATEIDLAGKRRVVWFGLADARLENAVASKGAP